MLNFHAKSKVKGKIYHKVKFDTSLKSCGHAESKYFRLGATLIIYTSVQNLR